MNYNFDLNSQESISFANVVMENNDNNLAARALLQSWAANIPTNLSLLNKNTKKTSTSSPLNKKDRIIPSKRSSTVNKQIEKLENQLEKEKKLQKYKQEILEQKLKSDLEIYRKEYKVLRELEKTMIKPNGNNSKISRNEIGLSKRNNHINDKNDLEIIDIENIENKENLLNEKNKMTMDNIKCRKNDKLNIENRKSQITSMINSNNNNLSTKNKNTQETTLYENKEEKKDENVSVTNSMKTNNNSSLSNHIANTLQSLKNCSTDEVIHIIDDLIQNNTMNNNYNNNNKNINNNNKNIINNNNSINNNDDTININKNNNENSKIIINNNKNSRDSNNIISSSNSNINEKKDKNYHENIDPENSIIYKEKIIHEKVVNIIKNKENSNDNGKNNIDHNEIIIENKEIIDRSSIESIYHMKVHLKAWYLLIVNDKFKCNNFQEKNKWKLKNYIFSTWMKAYKRSKNRREIIQEAENYKNEQIKWIKATKYWMQTTKSKYFAAWTIYSEIIKQENQIKEQHKTRVKKMNEFLNRAKQRLTQKECKEEAELKMNPFNPIIDQDKNLSKKLSQRNNKNGFFTLNEKESFSKNEKNKEVKKELSSSSSSKASTSIEAESTPTTITTNTLSSTNTISNTKNNKKIVTSTTTSTSTITSSSVRKLKLTKPKITKADKKFCEEMEKRNQAILERKRQSEQRRKEKEEKLKKQKEEEERRKEEERKLEIQRERQKKIEEKKKAKLEQIEKEKRHEKFLKDVARAKEHYQRTLISNYGLYPWIQYRKMIQSDTQEAEQQYQIKIKKQFFLHWYSKILDRQSEKEHQALTYYRKKCLKKYFTIHFQAYQEQLMILENCDELYLFNLMKSVWSQWLKRLEEKQEEEREKQEKLEKIADNFAKDYIPKRFLRKWISYYRNKKDEQWREYRKDLLRGKVKEWLSHSILNTKNICQQ